MLIVRVYSILDQTSVEVSCVHGDAQSHLVYREQRSRSEEPGEDLYSAAEALSRALDEHNRGALEWTDDCGL